MCTHIHAQAAQLTDFRWSDIAELCMHLRRIELTADLFVIPWLMTLFSHVLPLQVLCTLVCVCVCVCVFVCAHADIYVCMWIGCEFLNRFFVCLHACSGCVSHAN
jgi:hypothetical protein